jgi:hypothetical protein
MTFKPLSNAISFSLFVSVLSTLTTSAAQRQPPIITQEPTNLTVSAGASVSFSVTASGNAPLRYQWYFSGIPLRDATHNSLTLNNVQLNNGGSYYVTVANNYGTASSAAVTLVVYTNNVSFDTNAGQFYFNYQGSDESLSYWYVPVWPGWTNGTLNELTCIVNGTNEFLPSNFGGLSLIAADGQEIVPWDSGNTFTSLSNVVSGSSLQSIWQANYAANNTTGSLTYAYTFQITGRTLSIQVTNLSGVSGGLYLDRCESITVPTVSPATINVPYLTLMNVLYWNGFFSSLYTDWEHTSASTIDPLDGLFSPTSVYYAQETSYLPRTDGNYNPVNETIRLTVSPSISDVLPNVQNPSSIYKTNMANYLVFDNWEAPFANVNNEVQSLATAGVSNLWVIVHNWQNERYDNGYPDVFPAHGIFGGDSGLQQVSQTASASGYLFAVHENYVDFYPDATNSPGYEWNPNDCALNTNGTLQLAWFNSFEPIQSYEMKPTRASNYLSFFAPLIHTNYSTTASFLDVHSAINPSDRVDYDANTPNPGTFLQTLSAWRSLYGQLRNAHHGPVSGEGNNHMLSLGYIDDVEAEIDSGGLGWTNSVTGQWLPLLVDFDLFKLHNLTLTHGVGYYERFYADTNATAQYLTYSNAAVLEYMATELAYGHGGFIPTPSQISNYVATAKLEENYVFPAQRLYANATPVSILYHDSVLNDEVSASDYIRRYPHAYYAQANSSYMSQVRVTYDNGAIVCVNRHPTSTWHVRAGQSGGWFDYNAMIGGNMVQWTGVSNTTTYTLPPNCGWVIFAPAPP